MMLTSKKFLAGSGVILLAAQLLSGCGQSVADKANTAGNSNTVSQQDQATKQELVVSAAASLKDSLQKISSLYEKQHPNVKIDCNFASSGELEQQIEQGAPADLFFSAGKKEMNTLVQKKLIDSSQVTDLLSNQLVLITPINGPAQFSQIGDLMRPDIHKVAIGDPAAVPAGRYAKEALVHDKLWQPLQSKFIFAKDVRQVLSYVETGNVDAGLVYKTDAMTSKQVKVALTVDPNSYQPVDYPVGIIKDSKQQKLAQDFYDFLEANQAKSVFEKYGFQVKQ